MAPKESLTITQAANEMRQYAELTARHSQNWNSFESICASMIKQAWDGGFEAGKQFEFAKLVEGK